MNRLAAARQLLADALSPVLPGRVGTYEPPRLARGTAPYVWIGWEGYRPESHKFIAAFPLCFIVDGADHAAVAMYEELLARLTDGVRATAGFDVRGATAREFPLDVAEGHSGPIPTLRGCVIDVAVTIAGRTLCTPDVEPATFPPQPLEVLS